MSADRGVRVYAAADAVSCDIGGGRVLLDIASNQYYSLNKVGAFVWELLRQPRSLVEIRDAVVGRYEVPPAICEADVGALIAELRAAGLVRFSDEVPSSPDAEEAAVPAMSDGGSSDARGPEPVQVR